jgi:hypothetical protein
MRCEYLLESRYEKAARVGQPDEAENSIGNSAILKPLAEIAAEAP